MFSSIWNNPSIKEGKEPFLWPTWLNKNFNRISDLYVDGLFQSCEEVTQKFNLMEKADVLKCNKSEDLTRQ